MWITNAAFADLFTVFAKVDGEQFTAFLVERGTPGLSIGREERKLGLKGSSTARVVLDDVVVPLENVLGAVRYGAKVALYTLNLGRYKLAAASVGQSKNLLGIATRYAKERQAFGKAIADHGLIREKLATMAARTFAAESALYRVAGYLDVAFAGLEQQDADSTDGYAAAAEEYAIECAMVKVLATETLDYCADECLQIHGGYGYTEEFPAARAWRGARVNRIYEGTNEINRLNIVELLVKRIEKGLVRFDPDKPKFKSLKSGSRISGLKEQREFIGRVFRTLIKTHLTPIASQQSYGAFADLLISSFVWESMCVRSVGFEQDHQDPARGSLAGMADYLWLGEADMQLERHAGAILASCGHQDWSPLGTAGEAWLYRYPNHRFGAQEPIAAAVLESEGYPGNAF